MKLSEIIYYDEIILSDIDLDTEFNRLITDIKDIKRGDVLIIPNPDKAPDFTHSTELPLAVICGINISLPENIPSLRVENPRFATSLSFFRYEHLKLESIKIIGVTGTNGKTSTATMIENVLRASGYKTGLISTGKILINGEVITDSNYSMTTPDPPLLYSSLRRMADANCNIIVMEVSSHALALEKLAPIKFDVGIFTNLSPEHMDFHKDMEGYFNTKLRLFAMCKSAIINIDDEYGRRIYDLFDREKTAVGILWRGDVWATNVNNLGFEGMRYMYHTDSLSFNMTLPLPGTHNVYNSMLAAAACIELGCKPCFVKDVISRQSIIDGRYEIIKDDISVIIDYAHTAEAFRTILKELSVIKKNKALTVVFGCGGNRDKGKRPIIASIAERYADRIIVTADNSRNEDLKEILSDIIKGFKRGSYDVREDRATAILDAIKQARSGDIVAIIGKGAEKYNIDKEGYHSFDEKEIVMSALKKRKEGHI